MELGAAVGKGMALPLTTRPLSPDGIATTVPSTVAGLPPALITAPFASVTTELAARFCARFGACCRTAPGLVGRAYVVPSTAATDEPTEMVWPATVAC